MIVIATLHHVAQINVINRICLPENYDIEYWNKIISYSLSYVKLQDNKVVAYIAIDCSGYIISLVVLPKHRGNQIATSLLNHATQNLPFSKFKLTVRSSNITAQKLYIKCGFKISHTSVLEYHDEDGIIMIK